MVQTKYLWVSSIYIFLYHALPYLYVLVYLSITEALWYGFTYINLTMKWLLQSSLILEYKISLIKEAGGWQLSPALVLVVKGRPKFHLSVGVFYVVFFNLSLLLNKCNNPSPSFKFWFGCSRGTNLLSKEFCSRTSILIYQYILLIYLIAHFTNTCNIFHQQDRQKINKNNITYMLQICPREQVGKENSSSSLNRVEARSTICAILNDLYKW